MKILVTAVPREGEKPWQVAYRIGGVTIPIKDNRHVFMDMALKEAEGLWRRTTVELDPHRFGTHRAGALEPSINATLERLEHEEYRVDSLMQFSSTSWQARISRPVNDLEWVRHIDPNRLHRVQFYGNGRTLTLALESAVMMSHMQMEIPPGSEWRYDDEVVRAYRERIEALQSPATKTRQGA